MAIRAPQGDLEHACGSRRKLAWRRNRHALGPRPPGPGSRPRAHRPGARLRVSPDTFAMIERDWPACIATLVDRALGPAAPAELRERASQWHELVGAANTLRDYRACDAFDIMAEMSKLTLPTLVIVGDDDRLTPPKYARYLHEHIAGSRLEVIPNAGHLVMAERPAAVNALIADFLAKL